MKIAFWSSVGEKSGVTTNMACIAAMFSVLGNGRSVLLENHYDRENSIGTMLVSPRYRDCFCEEASYFSKYGIEHLLKGLSVGQDGAELLRRVAVRLPGDNMFYIPQGYITNREVFNYDFNLAYSKLFNVLEDFADYVFIDTERSQNLTSSQILYDADLVVVNLLQNQQSFNDFFDNYSSLAEKCVFLIGSYQLGMPWNYRRICYEYHISTDRIGMIPLNMELMDANHEGRLVQYIHRNYLKTSGADNVYFMRHCKRAAHMIRRRITDIRGERYFQKVSVLP